VEGAALANNVDAVLDQIEVAQAMERFELDPNATSLKFLQTIYRSSAVPLTTRMRAAIAAIQFEHPKLAVTATIDGNNDFAAQLDRAIDRSRRVMIEAKPMISVSSDDVSSDDVSSNTTRPPASNGHKPSVVDRRYRRL
jgi:hypothetical protein